MSEYPIESSSEVGVKICSNQKNRAEEELRRFIAAVRTSLDGIITGDLNGNITDVNDAVLRMYGCTDKGDLIGRNVLDFVVEGDRERALQESMETIRTGQGRTTEYRVLTKNGSEVPVEITTGFITDEQGEPIGFVDIVRNISERKKVEFELQASEKRYRELADRLPVAVYESDCVGRFTFINEKGCELTGYSHEDIEKGLNILQVVSDEDKGKAKARVQRTLNGEKIDYSEYTVLRKDGSTFPAIASASAIIHEGKTIGLRGTVIDISERKKDEELLRESEERFRDLYESIQEPVAVYVGREGRLINYNPAFKKLFGYTDEELKEKTFLDLTHPDDRAMVLEKYRTEYPQEKLPLVYEVRGINKKGQTEYLEVSVNSYRRKGRVIGIEAIYRVITERKKMEEKLRDSEERVRNLYESVPDPLAVFVGRDGHLLEYNKAFRDRWLGYDDEELKDKTFLDFVHPDYHSMLLEKYGTKYSEEEFPLVYEVKGVNKRGEIRPFEISVGPYKKRGRNIGIEAMFRDVSERKRMERAMTEMMQKTVMMNEKLRVVGGLTRHDVRNKLSIITGNIYLNKKRLADRPDILESFGEMASACEQIVRIFDFAKDYEMLGVEELAYIDVEDTVQKAASLFSDLNEVKVTNECHGLTVLADSLLRHLFYNLIDNSLKYGRKISKVNVHFEKTELDELKLFYEDDGAGIPDDEKPNLFKDGYTTGKGSGHGLYLIKKMIEVYGWTIQETGEPGKGARFTMTIPKVGHNGKENYRIEHTSVTASET
jgi:PAS domain S-box-containing protein